MYKNKTYHNRKNDVKTQQVTVAYEITHLTLHTIFTGATVVIVSPAAVVR